MTSKETVKNKLKMFKFKNKDTRTSQFKTKKFNNLCSAANTPYTEKRWNKEEHGHEIRDVFWRLWKVCQGYFGLIFSSCSNLRWNLEKRWFGTASKFDLELPGV